MRSPSGNTSIIINDVLLLINACVFIDNEKFIFSKIFLVISSNEHPLKLSSSEKYLISPLYWLPMILSVKKNIWCPIKYNGNKIVSKMSIKISKHCFCLSVKQDHLK